MTAGDSERPLDRRVHLRFVQLNAQRALDVFMREAMDPIDVARTIAEVRT